MLREMTARELAEWQAFALAEPFGEDREDARFGSIVQILANINRKKHSRAYQLRECVVSPGDAFASASAKQDWRQMKMIAQMLTAASQKDARAATAKPKKG